jgi:membrane protease YdiL (CAAX protease family)
MEKAKERWERWHEPNSLRERKAAVLAVFASLAVLAVIQLLFFYGIISPRTENATNGVWGLLSQVFAMGVVPFVVFYFLRPKKLGGFLDSVSLKKKLSKSDIALSFTAGYGAIFSMVAVNIAFLIILTMFGLRLPSGGGMEFNGYGDLFLGLLLIGVLPSIFEEFTYRGVLLGAFKDSPALGVMLSSVLFSLMHANVYQTGFTFFAGLVMGYVVIKTGSILPAVIIHFVNNAWGVLMSFGLQNPETLLGRFTAGVYNGFWGLNFFFFIAGGIVVLIFSLKFIGEKPPKLLKSQIPKLKISEYPWVTGAIVFGAITTLTSVVWNFIR